MLNYYSLQVIGFIKNIYVIPPPKTKRENTCIKAPGELYRLTKTRLFAFLSGEVFVRNRE